MSETEDRIREEFNQIFDEEIDPEETIDQIVEKMSEELRPLGKLYKKLLVPQLQLLSPPAPYPSSFEYKIEILMIEAGSGYYRPQAPTEELINSGWRIESINQHSNLLVFILARPKQIASTEKAPENNPEK